MTNPRIIAALACLACVLGGCGPRPFEVDFAGQAGWSAGGKGYDAKLPGYHLSGDIGSATLRLKEGLPAGSQRLVIGIATSPGMAPNLEFVEVVTPDLIVDSRLAPGMKEELHDPRSWTPHAVTGKAERGTYLNLSVVGREVLVELTPELLKHAGKGFTIKWIDWYR